MTGIATVSRPSAPELTEVAVGLAVADRVVRMRITELLGEMSELGVSVCDSARQLASGRLAADLVIVLCDDVGADQLALFEQILHRAPDRRIIVVCAGPDGRSVRRALDAGVQGIVPLDRIDDALLPTVSAVLADQTVLPRSAAACAQRPALSMREKQILGMVVMGFSNREISQRLFLAESTVKSHLSSAFAKLGVRSRSEAADMILDPHGSLGTGILAISAVAE